MEHSPAHQTLLQRAGGNVHPRDQIPSRIHNGTYGREGENVDGEMRIVPIASERVEPIHTSPSRLDQYKVTFWRSIREPVILRTRCGCPWHHRKRTKIVGHRGRQHQHHHGRHEQRDRHDADGEQHKCAVNERRYDRHAAVTRHVAPQVHTPPCCGVRGRSPPSNSWGPPRIPKLPRTPLPTSTATARRQWRRRRQGTQASGWRKRWLKTRPQ